MTWIIIPGWAYIICQINVMNLGLVSKGFLVDPPDRLPLVFHGLLWDFPNSQATQGGFFLSFLRFLDISPLLDNMSRYLKVQWFSLWFRTRNPLSSQPKRSLVDQILAVHFRVRSSPTTSFSSWDGISVGVRRSSPASRLSSWTRIWVFQVSPQEASFVLFPKVEI